MRPVFHHTGDRTEGQLLITVLAYQLLQTIRRKLELAGDPVLWTGHAKSLGAAAGHRDVPPARWHILHVRKTTTAEPTFRRIWPSNLMHSGCPKNVKLLTKSVPAET